MALPAVDARRDYQCGRCGQERSVKINTGIAIFEVLSQQEAQRIVADEPVTSGGHMRGELRPYRLGMLRGRDDRPTAEEAWTNDADARSWRHA
jgi:hypothetical protein